MIARALLLFVACACAEVAPHLPADHATGYVLAWSDEFDGDALSKAEWTIRIDERFASNNTAANVSASDGLLHLAVRKEKFGRSENAAAGVISRREFKYGY